MYCRRSAVDDDRSRKTKLAVDDDRRQGRWAVDDARSWIAFYQAQSKKSLDQVDRNLDRIRETLRSIRRMRMSSATIPRHSSSSIPSSASRRRRHTPTVADDYAPLELPLKWRDPPPEYRPLELPLRWRNPPLPPGLTKAKPPWPPTPHPTIADGIRQSSAHRQSRDTISFDPTPDSSIPLQCAPPEAVSEHSSMFSASISSRNPTPHSPSEPVTIPALQLDFALLPTARVDPQLDAGSDSIADINFVEGEWVARHRSTLQHDSGPNNIPLCSGDLASSVEPDLSRADSSSSSHDQPLTALHASITSPPLSLYAHVTDAFHHLTPFLLPDPAASGDEWPHSMSLRAFSQLPSRMTSEPLLTHNWIPRSLNVSVTKTQTQESSQVMPTPGLCSRSVPRPTFLDKSFTGEVPSSLLKFRNLSKLELSNDRFNGSLPENICSTSRLQFLLLGQYFIGGEITHVIQDCMRLFELQLNDNYLTCRILPQIGKIKNLLNLCSNHIQVNLPHELGKLDKMVPLDVSYEKLSGIIPSKSKSMLNLILVNFFNNQLTCPVPIFAPFQKSPLSSLFGNKGLCGGSFESTFDRQLFLEPGKRKLLDIIRGDLKNGIISCACAIEDDDLMMAELLMTELRQVVSVSEEPIQRLGAYLLEGLVARIVSTGSSIYKAFKCKEPTSSELLSFMHILYEVYPCFKFGSEKDEFSWNSMVGALLRTWEIQDAQKLFGEMPKRHIMSWNNLLDEIKSLLCNSSCGKEFIPMVKHVVILHVVISTDGGLQICGNPKELNRLMNKLADRFKRRRIFDPGGLFMLSHAPRTESSSFNARGE